MSLKTQTEDKSFTGKTFIPGERLYLNSAGDKLVKEGDPKATALWCSEFHSVSRAEYDRLIPKKKAAKKK